MVVCTGHTARLLVTSPLPLSKTEGGDVRRNGIPPLGALRPRVLQTPSFGSVLMEPINIHKGMVPSFCGGLPCRHGPAFGRPCLLFARYVRRTCGRKAP